MVLLDIRINCAFDLSLLFFQSVSLIADGLFDVSKRNRPIWWSEKNSMIWPIRHQVLCCRIIQFSCEMSQSGFMQCTLSVGDDTRLRNRDLTRPLLSRASARAVG